MASIHVVLSGDSLMFRKAPPPVRTQRIRLLQAQADIALAHSMERTRSIETKASFVVAGAGLIATALIPIAAAADSVLLAGLTIVPLAIAVFTIVYAVRAIRPLALEVPSPRHMIDQYLDSSLSADELEDYILEIRAVEVDKRDLLNDTRWKALRVGFRLLVASMISLVLFAAALGLSPKEDFVGQTTPATQTPAS